MGAVSQYERSREERIKQNLERMRKLGLLDLSSKLQSNSASRRQESGGHKRKYKRSYPPSTPKTAGSLRRSSRLQNTTPVSYSEDLHVKAKRSTRGTLTWHEVGSRPEVYTEEDEKLLGSTTRSWTLFVDGCGTDGRRIYDPLKGKTCHQCRQKTLGHRTRCSSCQMVQGQFCGDCLFMRYGEHVLEALENPDWVCPVCRGICNCSLCRQAKGWPPTGAMYRKISSLGYKSVAHYLVQTMKKHPADGSVEEGDEKNQSSVKRSLPFSSTVEKPPPATKIRNQEAHEITVTPSENSAGVRSSKRLKKAAFGDNQEFIEITVTTSKSSMVAVSASERLKKATCGDKQEIVEIAVTPSRNSVAVRASERLKKATCGKQDMEITVTPFNCGVAVRSSERLKKGTSGDNSTDKMKPGYEFCGAKSTGVKEMLVNGKEVESCVDSIGARLRQRRRMLTPGGS